MLLQQLAYWGCTGIVVVLASVFYINGKRKEKKLARMYRILRIGEEFKVIKLKQLIHIIIEVAKREMRAEACSLYLLDEQTNELYFDIALGDKGHLVKKIRLKMGQGVAGYAAQHNIVLNISDINKDERFNQNRKIAENINFHEKAMLTLPITTEGKLLGVLQFINKEGGGVFTSEDEELMLHLIELQIGPNLEKAQLYERLRVNYVDTIKTVANAIDAKDVYTQGHCKRVAEHSLMIGRYVGMSDEELESLEYSALLHDVGKIGVQDSILNKASCLTDEEFNIMKQHPLYGDRILTEISHLNESIGYGAKYHHERYDGKGYCQGLKGEEIPYFARIIAIADTYDAMVTDRIYRKGLPKDVALKEIEKGAGSQFDPTLAHVFIEIMKEGHEAIME